MRALKAKLFKIRDFIFIQPIDKNVFNILFVYVLLLLFSELMVYQNIKIFTLLASRTWVITGIIIFVVIIIKAIKQLYLDIVNKKYIFLIGSIFTAFLLLWPFLVTSGSVIGQDATQQMAAGLRAFSSEDWNYAGKAFLDYPARQYLIAALPATIFGRTQFALKLGFSLPFWAGLLLFGNSIRDYANFKGADRNKELLVVAAVTAFFAFPYITEYYIYFEQALFPVSFSLQLIGWLLYFIKKPTLFNSIALIWSGSVLIYNYTTALAVVALGIFIIFSLAVISLIKKSGILSTGDESVFNISSNRFFGSVALMTVLAIGSQFAFSFLLGRGDRVTDLSVDSVNDMIQLAKTGLQIGLTNEYAVYSYYTIILWIYLAFSLLFILGKLHTVISVWTLAVFMFSQILRGYAVYPPQISFSRTLVTVPVLITAWFMISLDLLSGKNVLRRLKLNKLKNLSLKAFNKDRIIAIFLGFLIIANVSIGFINISKPFVQGDAAKYFLPGHLAKMHQLIKDLDFRAKEAGISAKDEFDFILYTDNVWFKNPEVYMEYLYPYANIHVLVSGQELPEGIAKNSPLIVYIINASPPDDVLTRWSNIETTYIYGSDNEKVTLIRIVEIPEG